MSPINWIYRSFNELTAVELYAVIELRNLVFVVEQNCVYQDADNKDPLSYHLMGWQQSKLVAYTRIIPPGISYEHASIGRVVTAPEQRGDGLGRELMKISIDHTFRQFNCTEICIGAQVYLQHFYGSLGFLPTSEEYLEDGIPHIEMLLKK